MDQHSLFISQTLIGWYNLNKRELPWRETKNPFKIWISEIILQQTRVAQGYDYYVRFIETFPDIVQLANADEDTILKLWQGLGYYSRARNLHTAAKQVRDNFGGKFPDRYEDILSLKGVGDYTAAAIASFAFDLPHAVVDGNVFRVLSRLFAINTPIDTSAGKRLFTDLANELLDKEQPGEYNQSIMDFGAIQCVPVSPDCTICPLADRCLALSHKQVSLYPVKQGKTKVKERFFNYLDIHFGPNTYLHKRTGNDIWKNLYELPLIETDKDITIEELQNTETFHTILQNVGTISIHPMSFSMKHVLSHRIIHARFYRIEITDDTELKDKYIKTSTSSVGDYAISRLVDRYFEQQGNPTLFS